MPNDFFSSDHHHGHTNILRYCNRPFSDTEEMTEIMIQNHNRVVKPGDRFFMLGDFAFLPSGEIKKIIDRMNGKFIMIKGNHDHENNYKGIVDEFHHDWLGKVGEHTMHMYHFPLMSWNARHYNSVHLHGHIHSGPGSDDPMKLSFDVGVDANYFIPLSYDELDLEIKRRLVLIKEERERGEELKAKGSQMVQLPAV